MAQLLGLQKMSLIILKMQNFRFTASKRDTCINDEL